MANHLTEVQKTNDLLQEIVDLLKVARTETKTPPPAPNPALVGHKWWK